jgi:MFS family permease
MTVDQAAGRPGGLFRHRDFRQLWIADLLSQFGNRINYLAVPLLAATTLQASAFEVAMLRTLQMLAYLVIGLQVGAWCDRLRCRPTLIITDLGRAVVFGSIPVAAAFGLLTLWHLFAVVTLAGVLAVFFEVAHQTYLPRLIDRNQLVDGNARLQANLSVSAVAAPSVAGYLVQYFGGQIAIGVNALSFLWSAAWLRRIRFHESIPARAERVPLRTDIRDGLRFVFRHPILRLFAETTTVVSLSQSFQLAIAMVFLLREVHLPPGAIGLISTTGLVGAVVGAMFARRWGAWLGEARMIWVCGVLLGVGYGLVPLTAPGWTVAWYPIGSFLSAFSVTVGNILQVSFTQAAAPEHLRGRVTATMRFLVFGTTPLGSLLAGVVASTAGLRPTLWVSAAGMALAAVRLVWSPLRTMRALPEVSE